MEKNKYLFTLSLLIIILFMGFISKDRSCYRIYNNKSQLIADTSLQIDKKLNVYFSKGGRNEEIKIYGDLLNKLIISQDVLDYGCETKIIMKLVLQRDSIKPYYHMIKDIYPVFDTSDICLNAEYRINKLFLVGQKFHTNYLADSFYMYLPIRTKSIIYHQDSLVPGVRKYIKNGYLVIEVNNYSVILH